MDKPSTTRKGYHWVVRSPEEGDLFFHCDHGSCVGCVAVELLKNFRGMVQSHDYGAYNICESKESVLLFGCWAHARRKFEQTLGNDPLRAQFAMAQIEHLYALDRRADAGDAHRNQHIVYFRFLKGVAVLEIESFNVVIKGFGIGTT